MCKSRPAIIGDRRSGSRRREATINHNQSRKHLHRLGRVDVLHYVWMSPAGGCLHTRRARALGKRFRRRHHRRRRWASVQRTRFPIFVRFPRPALCALHVFYFFFFFLLLQPLLFFSLCVINFPQMFILFFPRAASFHFLITLLYITFTTCSFCRRVMLCRNNIIKNLRRARSAPGTDYVKSKSGGG